MRLTIVVQFLSCLLIAKVLLSKKNYRATEFSHFLKSIHSCHEHYTNFNPTIHLNKQFRRSFNMF